MITQNLMSGREVVYASCTGGKPTQLFRKKRQSNKELSSDLAEMAQDSSPLDVDSWLPLAAQEYNLSPNLRDYIVVPVPSMISDVPNTNGVAFPRRELLKFQTEYGMPSYKTWKGKCCFREHANTDPTKAKGVILDVFLQPVKAFGQNLVKVVKLCAFDRTKDSELCNSILSGEENAYSMGASYAYFTCSVCAATRCNHVAKGTPLRMSMDGKTLAYRVVHDIIGFELSSVSSPAFISAISDHVMAIQ